MTAAEKQQVRMLKEFATSQGVELAKWKRFSDALKELLEISDDSHCSHCDHGG